MDTAIGYIRVSTDQQVQEGVSLQAQREKIEAYCKLQSLYLTEIIEDQAVSGSVPLADRPGGLQISASLRMHKAKHVVALKLDRLFRDAADALTQTRVWDAAGIGLHLIDIGGQSINTSTAMGRMFLTMMSGFAELERNLIAERTSIALQSKKARKEVYSALPMGYADQDGKLVPVADEQRVIADIMDMKAAGLTLMAIAADLNKRGIVGKRGGKYYARTIKNILENTIHH